MGTHAAGTPAHRHIGTTGIPVPVPAALRIRLTTGLLLTTMSLLAFAMWTVLPIGFLWLTARVTGGSMLMLPALVGETVLGISLLAAAIARLNRLYCRVAEIEIRGGHPPSWRRPLCGENEGRWSLGAVDVIMTVASVTGIATFVVWFVLFAHCYGGACSTL
jgi:hypothetical protein